MYPLDLLMLDPCLLPHSFHIYPIQPLLPWGLLSTWISPVSLIFYWTYCIHTPPSHCPYHGPVLPLLVPLSPSNIQGWVVCTSPRRSMLLLGEFSAVSALAAPPTRTLPDWPWLPYTDPLSVTIVPPSAPSVKPRPSCTYFYYGNCKREIFMI